MHVHADDNKRSEFKKLAFEWKKAPADSKDGDQSVNQVVAQIDSKFPAALVKW